MSNQHRKPRKRAPKQAASAPTTDARAAEMPQPDEAALEAAKAAIRSGPFTPAETITGTAPDGSVVVPPDDEQEEAAAAEQAIANEPVSAADRVDVPEAARNLAMNTERLKPPESPPLGPEESARPSDPEPESPVEAARARLAGAAAANARAEQMGAASTDVAQVEALIGVGELLVFIAERLEYDARDAGRAPLQAEPLPDASPPRAGVPPVGAPAGMVGARDLRLVPGMIAPEQADPPMPPLYSEQVQQGEAVYNCVVCGPQPAGVTPAMHAAIAHPPERAEF